MNNLLQLKGRFHSAKAKQPGPISLPATAIVTSEHLNRLHDDLNDIESYWYDQQAPIDPLISIHYKHVVAKSNRSKRILAKSSSEDASERIKGAKFGGSETEPHHIITYSVDFATIQSNLVLLQECSRALDSLYGGQIDDSLLKTVGTDTLKQAGYDLTKTAFAQTVRDAWYIDHFAVELDNEVAYEDMVVSLFDTRGENLHTFMRELGINVQKGQILGSTARLTPVQYNDLVARYPYLVAMALSDINKIEPFVCDCEPETSGLIPKPGNEPVIGVIDTPFDTRAYFSDWVESFDMLPDGIDIQPNDRTHGTCVSSIIVDGPGINPELEDGCGRFRVRHFGVATATNFSSFSVMRKLEEIVENNRDIKVWNLSLGSPLAAPKNFVSPEAAILDQLQAKYRDIVFVVAGTNRPNGSDVTALGAPADSINSLVVNATGFDNATASYSRQGPVLRFYKKPDVCCVGGDDGAPMHLCGPTGETWKAGTSFAAPWVARKMAYLMQVIGLTRETAKALIIDSAAGWHPEEDIARGYGLVPRHIDSILNTSNDEIRFVITGTANEHDTYNYDLPIPIDKSTHPFVTRATLCYFPECDRRQGVDYTATEMDLHFGRINDKGSIVALNGNVQGEQGTILYEGQARKLYRKWDNIKHVTDKLTPRTRAQKAYQTGMWGIKITLSERDNKDTRKGHGLPFSLVVTLKELNGVNRINDFIQRCSLRGWIVNKIDVRTRIDIYNAAEEFVEFDD